jgi:cytochrome c oxidase subunit 3
MFFVFYFVATALHGLHMLVGIGLLAWIIWGARAGAYSAAYSTPVAVVGLYWSFVDMVWVVLYPLIYLIGRGG